MNEHISFEEMEQFLSAAAVIPQFLAQCAKIQKHLAACPQCARQYKAMLEVSRLPLEALAEEAAAQPEEQTR